MTKLLLSSTALAFVLAVPAVAAAQSPSGGGASCPPGSWFCAEPPQQQAAPAGQPLQPLPDPEDAPPPPPRGRRPTVTYEPAPPPAPPVVVYQPPPPTVVVRPESPPPYEYAPPRRSPYISPPREWGLNLHLEGAMIGHGPAGDAGLGGAGFGLRYKPTRSFGIESDLDFLGGRGYAGDRRNETGFTVNGLIFLNPRSRAQIYLLAGFGWSWAHSVCDPTEGASCPGNGSTPTDASYSYFGGQIGAGLEVRLSRTLAFNVDIKGFMRSRTDNASQYQPEFTNEQGQTTNTSGGGLLTGGMTLYF